MQNEIQHMYAEHFFEGEKAINSFFKITNTVFKYLL